jgi:thiosulfate dehydrogenase (quinone) large subunit
MPKGPREPHTLETTMLGKPIVFRYSDTWVGYTLFGGRLIMAYVLLMAGLEKLFDPEWTAAGYLQFAIHDDNPFRQLFIDMAGSVVVDQLVIWGLTLTGLGVLLGLLFRWCAFWASIIMLMFWASSLEGGLMQGLPVAHGFIVTYHLVYLVLLFALAAFGAGRILGVDGRLEELKFVENNPWLRYVLG